MKGTQEGKDDGSVGDLYRLEVVQDRGCRLEIDPGERVAAWKDNENVIGMSIRRAVEMD
jgi:hypothetical protein